MATEVNITFTGICLFLTSSNPPRFIIGKTSAQKNCFNTPDFTIPTHYSYLTYRQNQRTSGKSVFKSSTNDEAVFLSGLVKITGNIVESTLTFPGGSRTLSHIVRPAEIAPAYTPQPTVVEDDITKMDPAVVAARIDLPNGVIATPIPSASFWHFFPTKGKSVRMQIAQAIVLTLHVSDDTLTVTEQPIGPSGGAATNVVVLKSTGGRSIDITIGNSSEPDIAPATTRTIPPVGPDFDFELHWRLFDRKGDTECPPVSFNEGRFVSGGFVTLGGGNCPPLQLP